MPVCHNCKTEVQRSFKFCLECGARAPPPPARGSDARLEPPPPSYEPPPTASTGRSVAGTPEYLSLPEDTVFSPPVPVPSAFRPPPPPRYHSPRNKPVDAISDPSSPNAQYASYSPSAREHPPRASAPGLDAVIAAQAGQAAFPSPVREPPSPRVWYTEVNSSSGCITPPARRDPPPPRLTGPALGSGSNAHGLSPVTETFAPFHRREPPPPRSFAPSPEAVSPGMSSFVEHPVSPAPRREPPPSRLSTEAPCDISPVPHTKISQPLLDFANTETPDVPFDPNGCYTNPVDAASTDGDEKELPLTSSVLTIAALITTVTAPGLLVAPKAFATAGVAGGTCALLVILVVNAYTTSLLVLHKGAGTVLMEPVYKYVGRRACIVAFMASLIGLLAQMASFSETITDSIYSAVNGIRKDDNSGTADKELWSHRVCFGVTFLLIFTLSGIASFRVVLQLSVASLLALLYLVIYFLQASNFDSGEVVFLNAVETGRFAARLALSSLVCHYFSIEVLSNQLADVRVQVRDVFIAYAIAALCYLVLGCFGLLGFRPNSLSENFLTLFHPDSAATIIANILLVLWMSPAYAIVVRSACMQVCYYCFKPDLGEEGDTFSSSDPRSCVRRLTVGFIVLLLCGTSGAIALAFSLISLRVSDCLGFTIITAMCGLACAYCAPIAVHLKRTYFSFKLGTLLADTEGPVSPQARGSSGCATFGHCVLVGFAVVLFAFRFL